MNARNRCSRRKTCWCGLKDASYREERNPSLAETSQISDHPTVRDSSPEDGVQTTVREQLHEQI